MSSFARSLFASLVVSMPLALAQEGPPAPAPELQQLAPLIGNWAGGGTATFLPGAPPTKWQTRGSYRWCLDNHFVQEDFEITFEGSPAPMVIRGYPGWDREQQRYVNASVNNGGEVTLHEMNLLPDGTLLQFMQPNQEGVPHAQRSLFKVTGDTMTHSIDILMTTGPSLQIVDGKFTRTDKALDGRLDGKAFEGAAPGEAMGKFARMAGVYEVKGTMVMAPDQPPMAIKGQDTFRSVFGGTVAHGHTDGTAEGMPGEYHSEVFWGFDPQRHCVVSVYVSNMGEMMVQRMIMEFDAKGGLLSAVSHSILGKAPPFESFRASYTRK